MPRSSEERFANHGMMLVISYAVLFLVNAIVIYFANRFFPNQVVLGTISITAGWALLHSAGKLALIDTLAIPFVTEIERRRQQEFSAKEWSISYFIINFVGIWLISRFSDQFGMGISAWYVALMLAAVIDFLQGLAMMQLGRINERVIYG